MAGRPGAGIIAERTPGVDGGHRNGWRQAPVSTGESGLSPEPVDNCVDSVGEHVATRPLAAVPVALIIFCPHIFPIQNNHLRNAHVIARNIDSFRRNGRNIVHNLSQGIDRSPTREIFRASISTATGKRISRCRRNPPHDHDSCTNSLLHRQLRRLSPEPVDKSVNKLGEMAATRPPAAIPWGLAKL